jgi:hypothetical protein
MKAIRAHRAFGAFVNEQSRIVQHARKSIGVWVAAAVIVAIAGYTISVEVGRADRDASGEISSAGSLLVQDLKVGDCFNSVAVGEIEAEKLDQNAPMAVDAVPCTSAHTYELISTGSIPSEEIFTYKDKVVSDFVTSACLADFETYIGINYDDSVLESFIFYPSETSWASGSRDYQCISGTVDGEDLYDTVKDAQI